MEFKPRRAHKKSRDGCVQCKERHQKCDETRPVCVLCATTQRQCSYLEQPLRPTDRPGGTSSVSNNPEAVWTVGVAAPPHVLEPVPSGEPRREENQVYALEHMVLLRHAESESAHFMMCDESPDALVSSICDLALISQNLMDEFLALSALHLSVHDPSKHGKYSRMAVELQVRALSLHNPVTMELSEQNCIPRFVFSALLGLYVLHDTLSTIENDFDAFLGKFGDYLNLQQGVGVICKEFWHVISSSKGPAFFVSEEHISPDGSKLTSSGHACDAIEEMLMESILPPASLDTCRSATKWLENAFRLFEIFSVRGNRRVHAAIAFPVNVPPKYDELLRQKVPEALVILAHFGVLLHQCREFWIIGSGGTAMIRIIAAQLGQQWHRFMELPNAVVRD